MTTEAATRSPFLRWTTIAPALALVALAATWGRDIGPLPLVIVAVLLGAAVLAAVQHAEIVAHHVGEPYGSLVLAVAVTVIEVGLIVTLMVSSKEDTSTLARDTVFAAVMITCNGILGLSLLVGAMQHGLVRFNKEGTGAALATVATLATVCLVLPTFTTSHPGPEFSSSQLAFAAVASLLLYVLFVLTQTRRHRDFFLPVDRQGVTLDEDEDDDDHAPPPGSSWKLSIGLLLVSLVAVVGLAKVLSPTITSVVAGAGLPPSFVGVVIALLVLAPETLAAVNTARRNRTQTASTWRSARRWPASASPFPRWRCRRSGSTGPCTSVSAPPRRRCSASPSSLASSPWLQAGPPGSRAPSISSSWRPTSSLPRTRRRASHVRAAPLRGA